MIRRSGPPLGRVLLVDDEKPILLPMKVYLEAVGWTVDCVRDVEEAKKPIACGRYDVAIIDLRLSPTDRTGGLCLVQLAARSSPGTRVIVLTAYGSVDLARQLRRQGVAAYLEKPTPLPRLASLMSSLVERRAADATTA